MNFKHSGDWGDIIYSLPAIRAMGGGRLLLAAVKWSRQAMTGENIKLIAPLLELQPYISEVVSLGKEKDYVDLDLWRDRQVLLYAYAKTLADRHLESLGLTAKETETRWLEPVDPVRVAKVVINRTERYRNSMFPWRTVTDKYRDDAVFIGLKKEYEDFCTNCGYVPYYKTETFLDAAKVMSGADLFIGNQSCCFAIAEGLKLNVIQETYLEAPDCIFRRKNARQVAGSSVNLPDL